MSPEWRRCRWLDPWWRRVLFPPTAIPLYGLKRHCTCTVYSWKTNQYGLTADTVTAFELVLPCGDVKTVTEQDEDLWFALKVCVLNDGDEGELMNSCMSRAAGRIE